MWCMHMIDNARWSIKTETTHFHAKIGVSDADRSSDSSLHGQSGRRFNVIGWAGK